MAVYVLLAFDKDEDAKEWIVATRGSTSVVAMYKKPTLFCDVLDGRHSSNRRVIGFTKGQRWHWWVCAVCHKPREMYTKGVLENCSLGRNILNDPTYGVTSENTSSD